MKFELVRFGDHFRLVKGASYSSKNLVEESDTGLLTINAFLAGGGYKPQSEKPFHGDVRAEHLLSNGDVLIAMTEQDEGLLGSPLVVHKGRTDYEDLLFSLDVAKPIATTGEIEPEFVFNVLRIPAFRKRAAYGDTGSTVQRLPYDAIGDFKIPKPPLPTQRAINRLAAAIDMKIWLNSRMADNLEKLSESVFKSWFIDFDPVKAKMAGEAPVGMDAATAALFPESMEESELGEVPTGWAIGPISQVLTLQGGYSFKSKDWKNSGVPVVKIGSVKPGFVDATQTSFVSRELAATVPSKFLLPRGSLVIGLTGYVGEVGLVERCPETPLLNQRVARFGLVNSPWRIPFAYCITRSEKFKEDVIASATGSAQANVSTSDILALKRVIPTGDLIERFDALFEPLFEQMLLLREQGASLRELRDSLLPRLVSGELEIPDEMLAA